MFNKIKNKILKNIYHLIKFCPTSYPYITGDGFRAIANHVYDETGTFNPLDVKLNDIIFVKSDLIDSYFKKIHPKIQAKYKLITHNSDCEIGPREVKFLDEKIINWFAQNNTFPHSKLTPIPIGIENKRLFGSGYLLCKIINKLTSSNIKKNDRILFGFNTNTNFQERQIALDQLRKNPQADGITSWLSNVEYLKLLNRYKFVASPPGNGVDCHRTWEALYLGVTPIVRESTCMDYFKNIGLPILINSSYDNINTKIDLQTSKNIASCYMRYWVDKIKN